MTRAVATVAVLDLLGQLTRHRRIALVTRHGWDHDETARGLCAELPLEQLRDLVDDALDAWTEERTAAEAAAA